MRNLPTGAMDAEPWTVWYWSNYTSMWERVEGEVALLIDHTAPCPGCRGDPTPLWSPPCYLTQLLSTQETRVLAPEGEGSEMWH